MKFWMLMLAFQSALFGFMARGLVDHYLEKPCAQAVEESQ